jgi:hypothetical protein
MGPASEELMAPARTPQGIRANQHFANFFVDECRRNGHRWEPAFLECSYWGSLNIQNSS